jgi:hypothetical protein
MTPFKAFATDFPPTNAVAATIAIVGLTPSREHTPTADSATPISADFSRMFACCLCHQPWTPSPKDIAALAACSLLLSDAVSFATACCRVAT